ncbi:hypothetical protein HELRODRAFT_191378 [Helobdella robusta]|uniref:Uncharacterized protein n=1 Tax=Helobdella robusta TaxID=6412 RepID=T1FSX8_HELRO|nr:hypothetical protein HELRODRAFT_191378 [Helobdella robusta]ESO05761.1 hypothetical protein HELRODRAFT_191378 [Helobdella robusta]
MICLADFDNMHGLTGRTGKGGTAVSFLYNLSKLRHLFFLYIMYNYKGDPSAFKAFLKANNVTAGTFLIYVENRLNLILYMDSIDIHHEELLRTFLRNNNRNKITKSCIGIKQVGVMVQFQALGIIGKIITGPWMTLVYRNIHGLLNLEMGSVFQLGKSVIEGMLHHPAEVMLMKTDVFGHPLKEDVLLSLMNKVYSNDMLYKLLISLMQSVIEVMERQMGNYLTRELSNPTPQMIADTSSASPHNIHAERTFALSDFFIRKSPCATIGFVNAKVKAKMNHTMDCLDAKSEQKQNKIIKFAITWLAKIRHISKDTERQTDHAILERRRQLSQKTEDKDRKNTEHAVLKLIQDRKKKKDTFIISYWEVDKESAEDHKLPVESLITDLINGYDYDY